MKHWLRLVLWLTWLHVVLSSQAKKPLIWLLDIDNTLYDDRIFGIEEQIRSHLYRFCQETCDLSPKEADDLHFQYGSTIEGIRKTLWKQDPDLNQKLQRFYDVVYPNVDCSRLLEIAKENEEEDSLTGYSDTAIHHSLRDILQHTRHDIEIASNSPLSHVQTVWQSLGLAQVLPRTIRTPTTLPNFPTKVSESFWQNLLQKDYRYALLDDSQTNLERFGRLFQTNNDSSRNHLSLLVDHNRATLVEGLAKASGWIPVDYTFSDIDYLRDKNRVDAASVDVETWDWMLESVEANQDEELIIVDVGAGLLSMLEWLFKGTKRLRPLPHENVHYVAFETNRNLRDACIETLRRLGFLPKLDQADVFVHSQNQWTVTLHFGPFTTINKGIITPHLIVGSCFADLFEPYKLVTSLVKTFLCPQKTTSFNHTTIYFPLTFAGVTSFLPPQPFGENVPSDTLALRVYTEALKSSLGHTVDPTAIESAMRDYGATILHGRHARSDWVIDPEKNAVLWNSMLYFLGITMAPELTHQGWDAEAWLERARVLQPTIRVANADLLFRMPHLGKWQFPNPVKNREIRSDCEELIFASPRRVKVVRKPTTKELSANQIRIRSECSLISSGTELKVFQGKFDDAALDANIKGMADERMAYPLAYGYSLVGRVVDCGSNAADLMGEMVFSFSAHASEVVTEQSAVQIVPDGIAALDAIFMPSVETALSLIQEARPILGENVAVFGQGLIGLLVTCLLRLQQPELLGQYVYGTISTFDTLDDRLVASAAFGSSQALLPSSIDQTGPFDVAIEVSGNGRALQAAIDSTRDGGRIVVGSWYGTDSVKLKLGIDFHRSHKSLIASQVSEIPAWLRKTWTKDRRFGLTWELVKQIRPSSLLTKVVPLEKAQEAYEDLETGGQIAVAFLY